LPIDYVLSSFFLDPDWVYTSLRELKVIGILLWQGIGVMLDGLFGTCTGSTVSV